MLRNNVLYNLYGVGLGDYYAIIKATLKKMHLISPDS